MVAIDAGPGPGSLPRRTRAAETVEIALVEPVAVGDELLVHAGTAIAKLDQEALPA